MCESIKQKEKSDIKQRAEDEQANDLSGNRKGMNLQHNPMHIWSEANPKYFNIVAVTIYACLHLLLSYTKNSHINVTDWNILSCTPNLMRLPSRHVEGASGIAKGVQGAATAPGNKL